MESSADLIRHSESAVGVLEARAETDTLELSTGFRFKRHADLLPALQGFRGQRQRDRQTDRKADRQTDRQTGRQKGRETDRLETDRQTDIETDRQTGRQADRQTERQRD
ncbi:hypothetical protein DPX16_10174 [Anabarilius grahami]|uniref:Uncharacterized protein n=1 Tax=Anabarilius grahami TaxID=495550 RepID=A0A3N0XX52_ANAGA|nr:hypothetical protein DPX16_10174 [Anabarilius grahami]